MAPRRVLLVEDDDLDAALIERLLRGRQIDVVRVSTLASAQRELAGGEVDALLLDLRLPDGEGVQTVESIRESAADTPIVVLTGEADERLALSCISAGAQDYLRKAELSGSALRRAIRYARARSSLSAERRRGARLRARLAAIVETSLDAIISVDESAEITSWNRGAERILGLPAADVIGKRVVDVLPVPEGEAGSSVEEALGRGDVGDPIEVVCSRPGARPVILSIVASRLPGGVEGEENGPVALIGRDVTVAKQTATELRRRSEEVAAKAAQLRALAGRLVAIREEEQTRISRTVHDELGQLLTGLKLDLRWALRRLKHEAQPEKVDEAADKLREAELLLDRTLELVRRIATELRPAALDALGLPAALRDELRRFSARTGVQTSVETPRVSPEPEVATGLFRIFQELITNVVRHASAEHVNVELLEEADAWCLRVEDDGVGIDPEALQQSGSLGILGMSERALALGGELSIEARPVSGTRATVTVPKEPG